jgi:hypothetical protein
MKLEELITEWALDSEINTNDLVGASTKPPKLHSKYYEELVQARLLLLRLEQRHEECKSVIESYYNKTISPETMQEWGLSPDPKRYLKSDVDRMTSIHPKMVEVKTKIGSQVEKVKFLEDVIKMIHNMNFAVKNCIDAKKFNAGMF